MGRLVEGKWRTGSIIISDKKGGYDKIPRSFRDSISKVGPFSPESMHYRTYKNRVLSTSLRLPTQPHRHTQKSANILIMDCKTKSL